MGVYLRLKFLFFILLDKLLLLSFLTFCDYNVENAEKRLRKNLKMRKKCPKLFKNRDVFSISFQETRNVAQVFPMPQITPDGYEIVVFRLKDKNPRNFVGKNILRYNVTMLDAKFLSDCQPIKGSIGVIDLTGFSFRHFVRAFRHLSMQNSYGKFVHQAAPWNPVRIHVIHCPAFMKRVLSLIGPRVRSNYMELMNFHDDFEIIDEAIPREYLPNEFGGTAGSIDDIHSNWTKILESKRCVAFN